MRSLGCLVVLLQLSSALGDFEPPRVSVDLEQEPEHRWDHVVAEYKSKFLSAIQSVFEDPRIKPVLPVARTLIGNEIEAKRLLPGSQYVEARGIARGLGLDVADIVIVGAFYDVFAAKHSPLAYKACTGVVAQSSAGEIIHGRNLDYPFAKALADVVLAVDFKRNGTTLFTAVTIGPNPNFDTAARWGSFSVTQDERDRGGIWTNLLDMLVRGRPAVFSRIRQAVETVGTFDEAVSFFSNLKINAASYFILGGTKPGEGAVLTCDRDKVADAWKLDAEAGRWYLVETNYDHYSPPARLDDRRHPIQRAMNATGSRKISADTMWDVISIRGVNRSAGERPPLNSDTIYSTVMQASSPESFKTVIRTTGGAAEMAVMMV
mmetsp:Transcript_12585/g.22227  ORF Transcript_12585/g.22227 Transcript_12585/m.22227 type:complete len:377 (-) Transcript_12585:20-1150(-)